MHPILSDRKKLTIYLIAWLIIGFLLAALLAMPGGIGWLQALVLALPMADLYSFICLSGWYLCRSFPLEKANLLQLLLIFLASGSLSSSLWLLAGRAWVWLLNVLSIFPETSGPLAIDYRLFFGIGVVLYLLVVAVLYLILAFEETRKAEQRTMELRFLAQEAELKALRAQIDPHFLFNSLNSISALTTKNPQAARDMTILLADFFRRSVKFGTQESIPLQEEIDLAMSFLQIEKIRFGERLTVSQNVDESSYRCLVPPLIIQPLVENAVNHGIKHLLEGGTIRLEVQRTGTRLSIVVENPCDPERSRQSKSGLGLDNVRNRLRTLHNSDARLDVSEREGLFRAELSLPALEKSSNEK